MASTSSRPARRPAGRNFSEPFDRPAFDGGGPPRFRCHSACIGLHPFLPRAPRSGGCEPDSGGCSMASRLFRRAHCRRIGGGNSPWRSLAAPRSYLYEPVYSVRDDTFVVNASATGGLALSLCRGLLLTRAAIRVWGPSGIRRRWLVARMLQREVVSANAWPTSSVKTDDPSVNEWQRTLTAVNARVGAYYDNALRNTFSTGAFR